MAFAIRFRLLVRVTMALQRLTRHVAFVFSLFRNPYQAVLSWTDPGQAASARVALFVHFDSKGVVRPYVRAYLAALRQAGLSVFFVSNAGRLEAESLDFLKTLCAGVLVRRNVGYDFAAMREGLSHFNLPREDTGLLVLANDSVYGPLRPLADTLAAIRFDQADVWGATESWQARYHLQSYFLAVGPAVLRHPAWAAFWAQARPVSNKSWVILKYEIGFTQWMIRAGLSCAAIWPYNDLVQDVDQALLTGANKDDPANHDPLDDMRREHAMRIRSAYVRHVALNPTSDLWRQLLHAGYPFIKRELVRENPTDVGDAVDWRMEALRIPGADIRVIEGDLRRILRNRVP